MKAGDLTKGVELVIRRAESAFVEMYRDTVWIIFMDILDNTPQLTGKAVAHWNIGLNAPDYTEYPNMGDAPEKAHFLGRARQRGDVRWINIAKRRAAPKIQLINRRTRVYFTNAVRGDTDGGKASEFYMEAMQDKGYWITKLRAVNRPYETAAETIAKFGNRWDGRKLVDTGSVLHLGLESWKRYLG